LKTSGTHKIIEGAMMSILSDRLWLEIIGLALGVSLLEGSVTGKLRKPRTHRHWPVPLKLRPVFATVGFSLMAFALIDFFWRLKL
jgi:hypothetical protein